MLQEARGAIQRLFEEKDFTAVSFAEAVNYYVNIGERAAVRELEGLAQQTDKDKRGFSVNERVGWVCRVLFEPKDNSQLRSPQFGVLEQLPPQTTMEKTWPMFPLALSGSTYFVLSEGYVSIVGQSEHPKAYIEYCREHGVFRDKKVVVPTRTQALRDLAALRASVAWSSIKWTYNMGGTTYTLDEQRIWEFIRAQANRIR